MGKSTIKKQADELLGYGFAHQQVYDQLHVQHPDVKPKKLAELLRNRPSAFARQRYADRHMLLLLLIALNGVVKVAETWDPEAIAQGFSYRWINVVPIATVLVGYGIYRWQGELFRWIGWANIISGLSLLRHLQHLATGHGEPWPLALSAIALAIGVLAVLLSRNAFPKYTVLKDPLGALDVVRFEADNSGQLMR